MIERDDMTFPFAEYQRRIDELRERMAMRLMDAVIITDPENLMYLTDYQTTGYSFFQALVVPLEDEPFMITRAMEESNVIERTWVEHTRPYPDTGDAMQMLVESLRAIRKSRKSGAPPTLRRPGQHLWVHRLPFKVRFKRSKLYVSAVPVMALGAVVGFM